jgi:hypothetical protein
MAETHDLDARLVKLLDKRGQELVRSFVEEFRAVHREIAALRRELSALSDYQAMHDRLLVIDAAASKIQRLPRVVTIEADQNLRSQDGFYALEHTSDGTPFRWTGPAPQFSFNVFVDRSDAVKLKLDALSFIDFEIQKNISLLADGESIPVYVEPADAGFEVTATLPPRADNESTNLVFILPAALEPPGSDDTRTLGLAFRKLRAAVLGADVVAEDTSAGKRADEFDLANPAAAE